MPHYKKLVGTMCYLSPCSPEDAAMWAKWDNDLEVTIPLGDEAYIPYAFEKSQQIVDEVIRDQSHVFSIVDLSTDGLIGRCMLFNIDHVNRHAMLGIVIGEKDCWGQGYGQDAIRLLLDYAFNLLNLNSVMLGTFSFNERAIACYKKVGFRKIGRRRQARIIGSKRFDAILMDILAEEYESAYLQNMVP